MSGFRTFGVTLEALGQAQALDLKEAAVKRMAKQAAPLTHANGNRRFEGFWMRIENGQVVALGELGPLPEKLSRRKALVGLHKKAQAETLSGTTTPPENQAAPQEPAPIDGTLRLPIKTMHTDTARQDAKARVERAIALHFPRNKPKK